MASFAVLQRRWEEKSALSPHRLVPCQNPVGSSVFHVDRQNKLDYVRTQ